MSKINSKLVDKLCVNDDRMENIKGKYEGLLVNRSQELREINQAYRNTMKEWGGRREERKGREGGEKTVKEEVFEKRRAAQINKIKFKQGLIQARKKLEMFEI